MAMFLGGADFLTSGAVIETVGELISYTIGNQETLKPFVPEQIYRFILAFGPMLMIILRTTNIKYKPPIEKIDGRFQSH